MVKERSRTTRIDHDGGFTSYLQERPSGQRVVVVYLDGARVGCNPFATTNQREAACALIDKYLQEQEQEATTVEVAVEPVSDDAQAWNEQQPS